MISKKKILVVEDNKMNRMLLCEIVTSVSIYEVLEAENGQEALRILKQYGEEISLILLDLVMPVMDGYEATKEIRKFSTRLPIIAITAFAYASDEQKVMESGFDAYMSKPINANQLKGQITSILKQHIMFM